VARGRQHEHAQDGGGRDRPRRSRAHRLGTRGARRADGRRAEPAHAEFVHARVQPGALLDGPVQLDTGTVPYAEPHADRHTQPYPGTELDRLAVEPAAAAGANPVRIADQHVR
jgi:hypothetical protein